MENIDFEVIEAKPKISNLLEFISRADETAFGDRRSTVVSALNTVLNWPSTFVVVAFDDGVPCGISSGQFWSSTEVFGWWTIRSSDEKYRGLGRELFQHRNQFAYSRGVSLLYSTAYSEAGRKMIEACGGFLIDGYDDEYEHILFRVVGGRV